MDGTDLLLILVDAYKFDYLSRSTFTKHLGQEGSLKKLKTLWGYSAGIHPSIWTGTKQATHGKWMKYLRKQEIGNEDSTGATGRGLWGRVYYRIPSKFVRTALNKINEYAIYRESPTPPGIPQSVSGMFEVEPWLNDSMQNYPVHFANIRVPSLFTIMNSEALPYSFYSMGNTDNAETIRFFLRRRDKVKILLVNSSDLAGHTFGPESTPMDVELSKIDQLLKEIVESMHFTHLIVFSDHGMSQVERLVDVQRFVKSLNFVLGKDYVAFYDATFARFWFNTPSSRREIHSALDSLNCGKVLTDDDLKTFGIDFKGRDRFKFGELIFAAHPGDYIFPNYLHCILGHAIKGIHGYSPVHPSSDGIFIYKGPSLDLINEKASIDATDIFPTILTLLRLKPPTSVEGTSAIEQK
jgi:hypothetical protein